MSDEWSTLLRVAAVFASLSLVSLGGGNTVLPEIHRAAVNDNQWMTDQQFAAIYAIAEAAPGPSSMIVSLVGLKAAGIVGALVAVVAILGPSSLLMYIACRTWNRFREARWRIAFERGLGPVSLGLLFSSGWTVVKTSDHSAVAYAITAVACALLVRTKVSPLPIMAVAGVLGALGLV
ncbi:MAG TPA: chromate transporter [Candidatus Dormibacteraeota bacterium]|nr:chromate transporter [Candidatus Dormibacteraeota bacterium]